MQSAVPAAAGSWLADWALADEYARLAARLASLPGAGAVDEAIPASSGAAAHDWREATLASFSLHRKAGLRAAMRRVQRAWDAAYPPSANLSALCPLPPPDHPASVAAPPCRPADLIAAARPDGLLRGQALAAAGAATRVLLALARPRQLLDWLDGSVVMLALAAAATAYMLRGRSH